MPYVEQKFRPNLDDIVLKMRRSSVRPNGLLNYLLFKLCKDTCNNYTEYKNYIGELNECVAEIRRRLLAPYEDERKEENGDVL